TWMLPFSMFRSRYKPPHPDLPRVSSRIPSTSELCALSVSALSHLRRTPLQSAAKVHPQPKLFSRLLRPTVANPFRIRTSVKGTCNSFRIRTYKTQDLKPFRINTYRKRGEGALGSQPNLPRGSTRNRG